MKQIDDEEEREKKSLEDAKYLKKKYEVVEDAGDSAEVLATKAAVAALKAKKQAERDQRRQQQEQHIENVTISTMNNTATGSHDELSALERRAHLLKVKSSCIQSAMRARSQGDQYRAKNELKEALSQYQDALKSIQQLDEVIPQLESIEMNTSLQGNNTTVEAATLHPVTCQEHKHASENSHSCCDHDNENNNNSGPNTTTTKTPLALPRSSDLKGISKMLRVDCLVGIGTCEMERGHYGAASEAFKDAILKDGECVEAWKCRGHAFLAMGATLIAILHLNKVVLLVRLLILIMMCGGGGSRRGD